MRKTRSWKHNGKRRKQYTALNFSRCYVNPYYDPLSECGIDKRNTDFMCEDNVRSKEIGI